MIASVILIIALLALFGALMTSYQISAVTRRRDQARAVLQSFCDQFLRQSVKNKDGTIVILFRTTTAPTGAGLSWNGVPGVGSYLTVPLGGNSADDTPIDAKIDRQVSELDEVTGVPDTSTTDTATGRMLLATFTARYDVNQRPQTISLTVTRTDDYQ
jgi:type II secretory pathway pseudopilin PulG